MRRSCFSFVYNKCNEFYRPNANLLSNSTHHWRKGRVDSQTCTHANTFFLTTIMHVMALLGWFRILVLILSVPFVTHWLAKWGSENIQEKDRWDRRRIDCSCWKHRKMKITCNHYLPCLKVRVTKDTELMISQYKHFTHMRDAAAITSSPMQKKISL